MKNKFKLCIDDVLPITQDFAPNYRAEGIYRINLACVNAKYCSTGNWGWEPFLKRYKTLKEAETVRTQIWKTIKKLANELEVYQERSKPKKIIK